MKGWFGVVVALVCKWFLWAIGQKPKVTDAERPGKLEEKLKDKIKEDGW